MTPLAAPDALWLEGATLFDGTGGALVVDSVVFVRAGRIEHVGRRGVEARPHEVPTLALRGKTLLPGLIDAHAHAEDDATLAALGAMGITQIRNPASYLEAPAVAVATGAPGPRPRVLAAGPAIDCPPVTARGGVAVADEGAMRAEVRRQAQAGYAFVKLYTRLPPALVAAGIDEAHACGLRVIGDLARTSWLEAARAGIDFLAHALPRHPSLLPRAARAGYVADVRAGRPDMLWRWFELVDLEGPEVSETLAALREHGVGVDPTLVCLEALLFGGERAPGDPAAARAESTGRERWEPRRRLVWSRILGLVARLSAAGVTLLAGTDTPRPHVPPGASLHRELALLVAAGHRPAEALSCASGRSAEALGLAGDAGYVRAGRRADLVLVDGDPLATIDDTTRIEWVMQDGVVYGRSGASP